MAALKKLQGPVHMVEGSNHLKKNLNLLPTDDNWVNQVNTSSSNMK